MHSFWSECIIHLTHCCILFANTAFCNYTQTWDRSIIFDLSFITFRFYGYVDFQKWVEFCCVKLDKTHNLSVPFFLSENDDSTIYLEGWLKGLQIIFVSYLTQYPTHKRCLITSSGGQGGSAWSAMPLLFWKRTYHRIWHLAGLW